MEERKYRFSWDLIGDVALGRPNLGALTSVEMYRLMQFTFRDILERTHGTAEADRVFYEAGRLAGREFCEHILPANGGQKEFLNRLQSALVTAKIGILRVEKADPQNSEFILTISEDLDCSGLPELSYEVCTYDEGFISGMLEWHTGREYQVKEIDCWCTGDRTCRFQAKVKPAVP